MSKTDDTQGDESIPDSKFAVRRLRRKLNGTVPPGKQRVVIAAIRNPNADITEIANANNLAPTRAFDTLRDFARGYYDSGANYGTTEWRERRGGARMADNYYELSDIQRGIVDVLARYPEWCKTAQDREIADRAQAEHELEPFSSGNIANTKRRYPGMADARRLDLLMRGEIAENEQEFESEFLSRNVSDLLEAAGWTELPDGNLDSLDAFDKASELPDAESTTDDDDKPTMSVTNSEPENSTDDPNKVQCKQCELTFDSMRDAFGHDCLPFQIVETWDELEKLPEGSHDDDIRSGVAYLAEVNNIGYRESWQVREGEGQRYGLFVSLTEPRDPGNPRSDVSGLVKEEDMFRTPYDYEEGDKIAVELDRNHHEKGLRFKGVIVRSEVEDLLRELFDDVDGETTVTEEFSDGETRETNVEDAEHLGEIDIEDALTERAKQNRQQIDSNTHAISGLTEKIAKLAIHVVEVREILEDENGEMPDGGSLYELLVDHSQAVEKIEKVVEENRMDIEALGEKLYDGEVPTETKRYVHAEVDEAMDEVHGEIDGLKPDSEDVTPGVSGSKELSAYAHEAVEALRRYKQDAIPGEFEFQSGGEMKRVVVTFGDDGGSIMESELAMDAIRRLDASRSVVSYHHNANASEDSATLEIEFGPENATDDEESEGDE